MIFNDYIKYLGVFINFTFIIFLTINPNPLYQLFLLEETGEPGENQRLSVECWQTLPTCDHMFDTEIEPMASVVGGPRLDNWATEAPIRPSIRQSFCLSFCQTTIWILRH